MGQVLLAASQKLTTCVVFFMKPKHDSGEYKTLSNLPHLQWASFGRDKVKRASDLKAMDKGLTRQALDYALSAIKSAKWDLIVLDEINNAVHYKLTKVEDVVKLLLEKPRRTALILTGKFVDERLVELADNVCHFINIKHPYDKGILARKGIDY